MTDDEKEKIWEEIRTELLIRSGDGEYGISFEMVRDAVMIALEGR